MTEEARILVEALDKLASTPLPTLIVLAVIGVIALGFAMVYALVVTVRSQGKSDKGDRDVLMEVIKLFGGINTSLDTLALAVQGTDSSVQARAQMHEANSERISRIERQTVDLEGNQDIILKQIEQLRHEQTQVLDLLQGKGESLGLIAIVKELSGGLMARMETLSRYLPKEAEYVQVPEKPDSTTGAETKQVPRAGGSKSTAVRADGDDANYGAKLVPDAKRRDAAGTGGDQPGGSAGSDRSGGDGDSRRGVRPGSDHDVSGQHMEANPGTG